MSSLSSPKNALKSTGLGCFKSRTRPQSVVVDWPNWVDDTDDDDGTDANAATNDDDDVAAEEEDGAQTQAESQAKDSCAVRHRHRRRQLPMLRAKRLVMVPHKLRVRKPPETKTIPRASGGGGGGDDGDDEDEPSFGASASPLATATAHGVVTRQLICWWFSESVICCAQLSIGMHSLHCVTLLTLPAEWQQRYAAQELSSFRTSGGAHRHCDWFDIHCASRAHSGAGSIARRKRAIAQIKGQTRMKNGMINDISIVMSK
jgi:hypothetical protein